MTNRQRFIAATGYLTVWTVLIAGSAVYGSLVNGHYAIYLAAAIIIMAAVDLLIITRSKL